MCVFSCSCAATNQCCAVLCFNTRSCGCHGRLPRVLRRPILRCFNRTQDGNAPHMSLTCVCCNPDTTRPASLLSRARTFPTFSAPRRLAFPSRASRQNSLCTQSWKNGKAFGGYSHRPPSPILIIDQHTWTLTLTHTCIRSGDLWTADDVAVVAKSVEVVLPRIHSLVVGPGLGRNPFVLECAKHVITAAMELNLPIVIDADGILAPHTHSVPATQLAHRGAVSVPRPCPHQLLAPTGLFALCQDPTLVQGYTQAILTPNAVEFQRLCRAVGMDPKGTSDGVSGAAALATKYEHTRTRHAHTVRSCLHNDSHQTTHTHTDWDM